MSTSYALQKKEQVEHMAVTLGDLVEKHGLVTVDYKVGRTRSSFQQAALEVWCRQVAEFFNEQDIPRAIKSPIFKKGEMDAPWSRAAVKNEIWRPIQIAKTEKESTTRATSREFFEIHEFIVRAFAEKGLQLPPWPVRNDGRD